MPDLHKLHVASKQLTYALDDPHPGQFDYWELLAQLVDNLYAAWADVIIELDKENDSAEHSRHS